jgi:NADH:ubiquinone oxidoreductase subunit 3 (subunit A)
MNYILAFLVLFIFVVVLYLRLIYEWNDGSLEWIN